MGEVTINNHIGGGLYNVRVDTGTAQRDKRVEKIDARIIEVDLELVDLIANRDDAQSALNDALSEMNSAVSAYSSAPTEDNAVEREEVTRTTSVALKAGADLEIAEILVNELEFEKTAIEFEKTELTSLVLEQDSDAWCCDLTVGASGDVASIEVPGENDLILIAPGAKTPTSTDGHLESRGVQFGHQCYYNAAILPGWQKFMPTYRLGVITGFNADQTCSVTLDAAASSALDLNINLSTGLLNVPIEYMTCNRAAFLVNDRVVVKFDDQSWSSPKVVGFESNPKGCNSFIITPSDSTGPYGGNVMVYPSSEGVAPALIEGDDLPFAVAYERFGSLSKFSHDTQPFQISCDKLVPYAKGKPLVAANNVTAVFAITSGRYIIIESAGFIYSTGIEGTTSGPYDPDTNPDGYAHIGTMPYSDYVYIRPDGGKVYGFDNEGYCSVTISEDGFSAPIGISVAHEISDGGVSTLVETGLGAGEDGAGSSGTQTQQFNNSKSYSGPIGVFWTGSPGAWVEQIVTASSSFVSSTYVECLWTQDGATYDGSTTLTGSQTQTLDIDAGAIYSKRITDETITREWNNTFENKAAWNAGPFPLGDDLDETTDVSFSSVLPRFLGGKDYVEEVSKTAYTTSQVITGARPGNVVYNSDVSFGGNTATHKGFAVKTGETLSSSISVSGVYGTSGLIPAPISGVDYYYEFLDESGYQPQINYGFCVFEIVLRNSRDNRIAETASSFLIAEFATGEEARINGMIMGVDSKAGPYLSSYGFLDALIGLGPDSTGGIATVY